MGKSGRNATPKLWLQRRYKPGNLEAGIVILALTDDVLLPKLRAWLPQQRDDERDRDIILRRIGTPGKRRRVAIWFAKDVMAQHVREGHPPATEIRMRGGAETFQVRHPDGSPFCERDVAGWIALELEAIAAELVAPSDDEWSEPSKPPIDPATGRRVLDADGERRFMDEVVLETFKGPRPSPEARVVHLDGDLANDELANLAWSTDAEPRPRRIKGPRLARNYYIATVWHEARATWGVQDADEFMDECTRRWAALADADKAPYLAMARNDKRRYDRESGKADVSSDEELE